VAGNIPRMWWTWLIPIAATVAVTMLETHLYRQRAELIEKIETIIQKELTKVKKEIIEEIRSQE